MKTICVFCMSVGESDRIVCSTCDDYKGIMPLNLDTLNYLGEDPDDWRDEFANYRADQL